MLSLAEVRETAQTIRKVNTTKQKSEEKTPEASDKREYIEVTNFALFRRAICQILLIANLFENTGCRPSGLFAVIDRLS